MTNSRAQDTAATIVAAQKEVERADAAYRKGGSLDALNRANAKLAGCHQKLYEINAGLIPENDDG